MTTDRPSLTIVIPTYGRFESLRELLASIGAQTVAPLEVIVIDQNAVGKIDGILSEFVTHLCLDQANAAAARNVGFLACTSTHVLFVDDDEVLEGDHVERVLQTLRAHPEVRCLWPIVHNGDRSAALRFWRGRAEGATIDGTTLFRITRAAAGGIVFDCELFRALGGYDDLLFSFGGMSEDWELARRMNRQRSAIWCDSSLFIHHWPVHEGGCGTRTLPYVEARTRLIRSTVLALRLGNAPSFRLRIPDVISIVRFSFLSTLGRADALGQVIRHPILHLQILRSAIANSRRFVLQHRDRYTYEGQHLRYAPVPVSRPRARVSAVSN